jgi:hypothetical protein
LVGNGGSTDAGVSPRKQAVSSAKDLNGDFRGMKRQITGMRCVGASGFAGRQDWESALRMLQSAEFLGVLRTFFSRDIYSFMGSITLAK